MKDEIIKKQDEFKKILNSNCKKNLSHFTSNEFHTIWDSVISFNTLKSQDEQPKKTAEEILICSKIQFKKLQQEKPLLAHNILKSMQEYASQQQEVSDEEIEKQFPTTIEGLLLKHNIKNPSDQQIEAIKEIAHYNQWCHDGVKWLRDRNIKPE